MNRKNITPTNVNKLVHSYTLDDDVVVNQNSFESKEGVQLSIFNALSAAEDSRINNYSSLSLSNKVNYNDILHIKTQKSTYPEKFTTYLQAYDNKYIAINPNFLGEANQSVTNCPIKINSEANANNNENYFEIELIDEITCKISHFDNFKTVYLTYDGAVTFNFRTATGSSNQTFRYLIDRVNGYISLYTITNSRLFKYNTTTVLAVDPSPGSIPPEVGTSFKIRITPRQDKKIKLSNDWFSYENNIDKKDLSVSKCNSYSNLENNILFNSEYENISNETLPVNITPLKNQLTAEYEQGRNNPFMNKVDVDYRDYVGIFSGSNQIEGNDKISLAFENHTRKLTFTPGKVTYFHMPQDMYPYEKININDAGLIEAGAIGSDTPLRSDKIFKKQANYNTNSNFGNATDEQNGTYLCSWLLDRPALSAAYWVDRYYNPELMSVFQALSTDSPLTYTSDFETVNNSINTDNYPLFDKISDLTLEPGLLYAYHHIGYNDVKNIADNIPRTLQRNLDNYQDSAGNTRQPEIGDRGEFIYAFNGDSRASTKPAADINDNGSFTVSFDIHSNDWSKPIGNQLFGNYTTDGFGVFNKQAVTPFIILQDTLHTYILNSEFKLLNTIDISASNILRGDSLDNFHAVNGDKIITYDIRGNKLKETNTGGVVDTFMYNNSAIVLNNTLGKVQQINLDTAAVADWKYALNITLSAFNELPLTYNGLGSADAETVAYTNNKPYIGLGDHKDVDIYGNIWKIQDLSTSSANAVIKHEVSNGNTFIALSSVKAADINAIKSDIRGDVWILHNNSTLTKITNDRNLIFTSALSSLGTSLEDQPLSGHKAIDFIREFDADGLVEYCVILDQVFTSTSPASSDTSCYYFNMSGDFVKQTQLPVNLSISVSSNAFKQFTNYDHVKRNYKNEISTNKLHFKLKQVNSVDNTKFALEDFAVDVAHLTPGSHNFAYIANDDASTYTLFVDGNLQHQSKVAPNNQYRFSDTITKSFVVGTSPFFGSVFLQDALSQAKYYNARGISMSHISVYNNNLNYFDTQMLAREGKSIADIQWDIPGGKRGYIETIDRFNKQRLPGHKTNFYETTIHTVSSLSASDLIAGMESNVNTSLKESTAVNTKQIKSTWFYNVTA